MTETELDLDLDELSSAEDFLDYFEIDYDASVVHVNRLHILQRFHDYMDSAEDKPTNDEERRTLYAELLETAYQDFVESDAQTEKVFKVFRMFEPVNVSISLGDFKNQVKRGAAEV